MFASFFKIDLFFATPDMAKFSVLKLNDSYMTYTEGIKKKYMGYGFDKNMNIVNETEPQLDLEPLT